MKAQRVIDIVIGAASALVWGTNLVLVLAAYAQSMASKPDPVFPGLVAIPLLVATMGGVSVCFGRSGGFLSFAIASFIVTAIYLLSSIGLAEPTLGIGIAGLALAGALYGIRRYQQIRATAAVTPPPIVAGAFNLEGPVQ